MELEFHNAWRHHCIMVWKSQPSSRVQMLTTIVDASSSHATYNANRTNPRRVLCCAKILCTSYLYHRCGPLMRCECGATSAASGHHGAARCLSSVTIPYVIIYLFILSTVRDPLFIFNNGRDSSVFRFVVTQHARVTRTVVYLSESAYFDKCGTI